MANQGPYVIVSNGRSDLRVVSRETAVQKGLEILEDEGDFGTMGKALDRKNAIIREQECQGV